MAQSERKGSTVIAPNVLAPASAHNQLRRFRDGVGPLSHPLVSAPGRGGPRCDGLLSEPPSLPWPEIPSLSWNPPLAAIRTRRSIWSEPTSFTHDRHAHQNASGAGRWVLTAVRFGHQATTVGRFVCMANCVPSWLRSCPAAPDAVQLAERRFRCARRSTCKCPVDAPLANPEFCGNRSAGHALGVQGLDPLHSGSPRSASCPCTSRLPWRPRYRPAASPTSWIARTPRKHQTSGA